MKVGMLTTQQMQDRVDYLSETKRRDYRQWKASVLVRVAEIERQSQPAG